MILDLHGRCGACGRHPRTERCVEAVHEANRRHWTSALTPAEKGQLTKIQNDQLRAEYELLLKLGDKRL